jgi:ABC-type nitrate/sulfonate/bicarbonate transport system permease component
MFKYKILYIFLTLILFLSWEYFSSHNNTLRLFISSPSDIYHYFISNSDLLVHSTMITLLEAVLGLLIATAFSFIIMIIGFYRPSVLEFTMPLLIISQTIPLIVLAPFFIILLGVGLASKVAMAALLCFFPVIVNFNQGYLSISPNIHDLIKIYNARKTFSIFKIYIPLALPNILAGLKISSSLAIIGALVAEFSGANAGLGKLLFLSSIRLEPDIMMTCLVICSLIGLSLYGAMLILERKLCKWFFN